ncbi:MAG: hypothetical protein NTX03_08740 [Bacteroidetes bacterium]|nr:hypothetical protein [Bacteroidota bacterium]
MEISIANIELFSHNKNLSERQPNKGVGAAFFGYYKTKFTESAKWYQYPVWLLMLLRFISVSFLSFLLLAPVLKSIFKKVEKPVIVLAMDNSESILLSKDSAFYRKELPKKLEELTAKLSGDYDVRLFSFGSKVSEKPNINFKEKSTDIAKVYDEAYNRFYNQNIGAVITLTDGITNQGQDPEFSAQRFNAPFYFVALGDTHHPRDVAIRNVRYNQVVYSGNIFPIQIQLGANGYKGKNVQVKVSNKGNVLFSESVAIDKRNFYKEIEAKIEAKSNGMQHYVIEVSHLDGEITFQNNVYDVFIDVLDSKKKILIVAESPHPDVAALKKSIERNQYYEVKSYVYSDFVHDIGLNAEKLRNYQLVILHQLPGVQNNASQLTSLLKENEIPVLFILGSQTSYPNFNSIDAGLNVMSNGGRLNDVFGSLNTQFGLFTLSEELSRNMAEWPPLVAAFGDYKADDRQNIALYQQIGKVKTEMPLLMFAANKNQKTGILCGEGIYKWFMADYAKNQNFKASDEIIDKTVQYLSLKSDNRLFRVRTSHTVFYEDDRVSFDAEAYNSSYEPQKDAVIGMEIINEKGKAFTYTFQPKGNAYSLDAGFMPPGIYAYKSSTKLNGKTYNLAGEFMVKAVQLEHLETTANHQLLRNISKQQSGKVVYPKDILSLADEIEKNENIHSLAYMQTDLLELINFKWLFFFVLIIMSAEWFLRKYFGGY